MRIKNEGYYNIIWFAKDVCGNIIVAQSLESDIPEFIKSDAAKALMISEKLSCPRAIDREGKNLIDKEKMASLYGFYCYSADDPYESKYRIVAIPQKPRKIDSMPDYIKKLLVDNLVPFDASLTECFKITNGIIQAPYEAIKSMSEYEPNWEMTFITDCCGIEVGNWYRFCPKCGKAIDIINCKKGKTDSNSGLIDLFDYAIWTCSCGKGYERYTHEFCPICGKNRKEDFEKTIEFELKTNKKQKGERL